MIREIQELLGNLPGFIAAIISIILIVWAVLLFLLPFYIASIYEKEKAINKNLKRLLAEIKKSDTGNATEEIQ